MDLSSEAHYNVARDGKTYGPYKASKLCEMAASGRLQKSDHLWTDGMDDWHPVVETPELASQFREPAARKPQTQPEAIRSTAPAPSTTSSESPRATTPEPVSRSAESKPKKAAAPVSKPAVKEESKSSTIIIEEPAPLPEKPTDFEKINFDQLPLARMKSK